MNLHIRDVKIMRIGHTLSGTRKMNWNLYSFFLYVFCCIPWSFFFLSCDAMLSACSELAVPLQQVPHGEAWLPRPPLHSCFCPACFVLLSSLSQPCLSIVRGSQRAWKCSSCLFLDPELIILGKRDCCHGLFVRIDQFWSSLHCLKLFSLLP